MDEFMWDGPEDSDEEIPEMAAQKTEWEEYRGVKFSRKGIIEVIESTLAHESSTSSDFKTSKLWE